MASAFKSEFRPNHRSKISIDLNSGGPAGLIYGFLLIWLGNVSVFIVIGELSSAIPTAGW